MLVNTAVIHDNNDLMLGQPYLCPSAKPYLVSTINKQPCNEMSQVDSYMLMVAFLQVYLTQWQ